jgi:hypothetical protein
MDDLTEQPTPLEFLTAVYCNEGLPLSVRMRAAIECAQYRHPKLGVMAMTNINADDFASMLDRAIARSQVKLIEHREGEGTKPEPPASQPLPAQAHWPIPRSAKSRRF